MRHLGGIVIGFVGVVVGLVVIAAALGLTNRAAEQFTRAPLLLGTVLMLVGGAAIGAVAIFRRLSVAAPLTGAVVALLLTLAGALVARLALPARPGPGARRRPERVAEPAGARADRRCAAADLGRRRGTAGRGATRAALPGRRPGPSRPSPNNRGGFRGLSGRAHHPGRPITSHPVWPLRTPSTGCEVRLWGAKSAAERHDDGAGAVPVPPRGVGAPVQRPFGRGCGGSGGRPLPVHLIFPPQFLPAGLTRGPRPA